MDMLQDLESLQFEYGVPEEDRIWLYLQGRSRGLMIEACAHATFFCKLLYNLRSNSLVLCSFCLPFSLPGELQKLGIKCFYHNADLVSWADVIFLCCLPSQLPNICVEIHTSLEKTSIVYSFVAAIPLPRLKLLLNHTNILRPQYQYGEDSVSIWGANKKVIAALQDPTILQATCPYSPAGGIILKIKWLEGVFYAALNICTARNMAHSQVLQLLSELFLSVHFEDCGKDTASCPKFQLTDFVSKAYGKNLSQERPFPWFDLTAVQLKETPFSQHLSSSPVLQDHLTHLYCASFGISLTKEQPVVSTGSPSQ
ncbi:PREDICTED: NADP-dependent oxidoreductase domain-containing protein 1 [Colobus angolensis palliatus]|uniref:NADP-dependent oxidoreductase domain-containing protein 1 n=1 Tax=Colobus angolensis palliatus TaxID=336983 RepID=UPI0005F48191|nr:PREDICTED: NADP-dependent oxidoreductase domain-containing protein 1 [Colobus angolensis palliatus]